MARKSDNTRMKSHLARSTRGRRAAFTAALRLAFLVSLVHLVVSCASAPQSEIPVACIPEEIPTGIMGTGSVPAPRLAAFFLDNNPAKDRAKVERMAALYAEEAAAEGVNADVAFVQMCLETGFLSFGGLVTEEMNNFCGLGSIGPGQPGLSFPDERTGVRAHIQHLKAYGSTAPLAGELVDPRYKYVNPKGKSPTIHGLGGTWAADREYGDKLFGMLERLYR